MIKESQSSDRSMVEIDGTKVKQTREAKGLTQLYVATVVGVTTDTISRWENRKYPSIKRENGLKLARALDVDLESIIDQQVSDNVSEEKPGEKETVVRPAKNLFPRNLLILIIFLLGGGLGILLVFKAFQYNEPFQASARRILPDHVPAGAVFPVLINITVKDGGPYSLIVKEELPEGCRAIEAVPSFNTTGPGNRVLKWVSRVSRTVTITYLVRTTEDFQQNVLSGFNGEIVVGGKAEAGEITGDHSMTLAPYHWVDQDRDGTIDDEEILAFYNLFSEVEKLDVKRDLIDEIWASRGYEWDEKEKKYKIYHEDRQVR